jgi:hypothetical protein
MIDQRVIEVKMEGIPKTILKLEILLFLIIEISASHCPDVPNPVTVINQQQRSVVTARIRS